MSLTRFDTHAGRAPSVIYFSRRSIPIRPIVGSFVRLFARTHASVVRACERVQTETLASIRLEADDAFVKHPLAQVAREKGYLCLRRGRCLSCWRQMSRCHDEWRVGWTKRPCVCVCGFVRLALMTVNVAVFVCS